MQANGRTTVNKSISLEPKLLRRARRKALAKRQSFSGYVASLIDQDLRKAVAA